MLPKFEKGSRDKFLKHTFEKEKQILLDTLGKFIYRETISNSITFKGKQSLGPNNQNTNHTQHLSNAALNPTDNTVLADRPIFYLQSQPAFHPTPTGNVINENMGCYTLVHSSIQAQQKKQNCKMICTLDTVAAS